MIDSKLKTFDLFNNKTIHIDWIMKKIMIKQEQSSCIKERVEGVHLDSADYLSTSRRTVRNKASGPRRVVPENPPPNCH